MTYINACAEVDDLGGGRFRHIQHIKPVAYLRNGALRPMGFALAASKDIELPVGVDEGLLFKLDLRIAGKSPLWEIRGADRSKYARFALLNANNVAGQRVNEHEYIYPNALDGADLAFVYSGHRVSADFRLRAGHPSLVAWRMDAQAGFDPKRMLLGDLTIQQPVLLPPDGKDAPGIPLVWDVAKEAGRYILRCALPKGDYAGWTLDPTLTLQPDATDGMDTFIRSGDRATYNSGAGTVLCIGDIGYGGDIRRTLLRFSLSDIPDGSSISSATLGLYCISDYSSSARTFSVYRSKRAWLEGTRYHQEDTPATGATWNRYDFTHSWQAAGGFGTDDCEQTSIGSRDFSASETLNEFKNFSLTPTTKPGLDLGNGWLIRAAREYNDLYGFASSDDATAAYRPKLTVEYTLLGGGNIFQSAIMHSAIYGKTLAR